MTMPLDDRGFIELLRPIERERFWKPPHELPTIVITRSLPFYRGFRGGYVHRVRSGKILRFAATEHDDIGPATPAYMNRVLDLWCGQSGTIADRTIKNGIASFRKRKGGELLSDPGDGPVCGTCEGRAVGAGQGSAILLVNHPIVFAPRLEASA